MSERIFNELYISMKQAEAIAKGTLAPASVIRVSLAQLKQKAFENPEVKAAYDELNADLLKEDCFRREQVRARKGPN